MAALLLFFALTAPAITLAQIQPADFREAEMIPVQSGGRIKPFSSFAREVMIFVAGRERFERQDPVRTLFEWSADTETWERKKILYVPAGEWRAKLAVDGRGRISPKALSSDPDFLNRAEEAAARSDREETLTLPEKQAYELYQKMNLFYSTAQGKTWTVLPNPKGAEERWVSIQEAGHSAGFEKPVAAYQNALEALKKEDGAAFLQATRELKDAAGNQDLSLEAHYNKAHPFRWSWQFYLAAFFLFLAAGFMSEMKRPPFLGTAYALTAAGFAAHLYGFVIRCVIAGRPPVSNMYESVVWVSWGVVLFALVLSFFYRSSLLSMAATAVAAFGLILSDSYPAVLDPSIGPLVPVLRNNFWLTVHVLTITLSYGAFALALGIGHLSVIVHAFRPEKTDLLKNLTEFLYRGIQIGVILLSAGTILGGVWANYSWGRFWGWDPKETWALIALLGYLAILHARFVGWVGPYGLAVGSVVGFLGILMAWYGVNFVLAAGLHSYGFGGGGLPYVAAFVAADLILIAVLTFIKNRRTLPARSL